jgi:hypothetical protein
MVIMKNITPSAQDQPVAPDKPRRIPTKMRTAIDALVAGNVKTIADAARSVGGGGAEYRSPRADNVQLSKPRIVPSASTQALLYGRRLRRCPRGIETRRPLRSRFRIQERP